jgi:hypothetical protein
MVGVELVPRGAITDPNTNGGVCKVGVNSVSCRALVPRCGLERSGDVDYGFRIDGVSSQAVPRVECGFGPLSLQNTEERIGAELNILSTEINQHLIESYRPLLDSLGVTPAADLVNLPSKTEVIVADVRVATDSPDAIRQTRCLHQPRRRHRLLRLHVL